MFWITAKQFDSGRSSHRRSNTDFRLTSADSTCNRCISLFLFLNPAFHKTGTNSLLVTWIPTDLSQLKTRVGIESYWLNVISKQSGDASCQWIDPSEHLSYQSPQKAFEICEEDFRKTAMDYLMFQQGLDSKSLENQLLTAAMYSSRISSDHDHISILIKKDDSFNDKT